MALIRRRNIISRTIIVTIRTDAKLPMTAPATQEDPAPSIVKSARSSMALKDRKETVLKFFPAVVFDFHFSFLNQKLDA